MLLIPALSGQNQSSGIPTRSDTNQAVQQNKLEILDLESRGTVLFTQYIATAAQYCAADLCLNFHVHTKIRFSHGAAHLSKTASCKTVQF